MSSSFGKIFKVTTWGESHGTGVGVVVDGCPPGIPIAEEDIQKELDRRKPGQSKITTPRKESDEIKFLSGLFEGKSTGTPISMMVYNEDHRSKNYDEIKNFFRPGHADFTYYKKYGIRDYRGGGRSSGRETIGRVAAGAIAKKILSEKGIRIIAFTKAIGNIDCTKSLFISGQEGEYQIDEELVQEIERNPVRTIDSVSAGKMEELIMKVRQEKDSIGGIVECVALNMPAGLGEPVFGKLDAEVAKGVMSIGAVKGVEIGSGFELARLRGSQGNDCFINLNGEVVTATNRCGGVLGGISTGMPLICRAAVKPTPSIALEQRTVNISGEEVVISTKGRHDPCIVPRIIPVIESMIGIVLCDFMLQM